MTTLQKEYIFKFVGILLAELAGAALLYALWTVTPQ